MSKIVKYLGLRWSPEFNCWDFIRLFYKQEYRIELEPHFISAARSIRDAHDAFNAEGSKTELWQPVDRPLEGDVALFGKRGIRFHVGIMIDLNTVLHLQENVPSCAAPLQRVCRSFDTVEFFHHSNLFKLCQDSQS